MMIEIRFEKKKFPSKSKVCIWFRVGKTEKREKTERRQFITIIRDCKHGMLHRYLHRTKLLEPKGTNKENATEKKEIQSKSIHKRKAWVRELTTLLFIYFFCKRQSILNGVFSLQPKWISQLFAYNTHFPSSFERNPPKWFTLLSITNCVFASKNDHLTCDFSYFVFLSCICIQIWA